LLILIDDHQLTSFLRVQSECRWFLTEWIFHEWSSYSDGWMFWPGRESNPGLLELELDRWSHQYQQIKRLVDSAHYKALRIVYHDYKKQIPRIGLDRLAKRATPTQWGNYIISKLVISTFHNKEPYHMYKKINETFYTTRCKPGIGHFYNNSRGKIGKQSIQNRLAAMDEITREWTTQPLKGDALRTVLKKTFIPFDDWFLRIIVLFLTDILICIACLCEFSMYRLHNALVKSLDNKRRMRIKQTKPNQTFKVCCVPVFILFLIWQMLKKKK